MQPSPKNIVYVRPDTFGDLIIFAPALQALQAAWPEARHTLLVRCGYDALAPLFPSDIAWLATPINPFKDGPELHHAALNHIVDQLGSHPPDLIVAATQNRTWLEVALAARFPQARRVALGSGEVDPIFSTSLQIDLGIESATTLPEIVPIDEAQQEWENNFRLVDHLLGRTVARHSPTLTVPPEAQVAADKILSQLQLARAGYAVVFPAGLANVSIKAWPTERFAEIAVALQRERSLPVLLLGHTKERPVLESVADECERLGLQRPPMWFGRDGDMTQLAALLQAARCYFGHDTGPMHLAAAVGTPVAAIFGGGHWPRFRPVGNQVASIVQPLPCFGCRWDCLFGDAPCVKTLSVQKVKELVERLLDAGTAPLDLVMEERDTGAEALALIRAVTPRYRSLQEDRLARQHKIEELTHLGREKDTEIAALKTAAEDRKTEMEAIKAELEAECAQKDTEIAQLKSEADTKDNEIASLKAETNTKDGEIASLKNEADTKDSEILSLKAEANTKDAEIAQLKIVCNEREALIFKLTDIVKDFQQQVAGHLARHTEQDAALADRDKSLAALAAERNDIAAALATTRAHLAALPPDAADYGRALYDKDVHIRNIETMLRDARGSLDNFAHGFGALEQIKRYDRWLHEKESVIQQLKRACDERESLIRQLAAKDTGLSWLRRTWIAAEAFWRLKIRQPLSDTLFRRLVEEEEVQLGILRQYDPRPVVWDGGLPKRGRLPDARLPRIDIVTPSFNQDKFLESTILSVLNQQYPHLRYHVQDGASKDRSAEIIARYVHSLASWESVKDRGQADAIRRGFARLTGHEDDILAWLNSDDLITPRALRYVGEYFARHPEVDVIYGHRIVIDDFDQEIGRWFLPRHDPEVLEWIDYVPQETMFFRRRIWDAVGGIDPSFQFALDWDLIARFQHAGARIVRVPYFLGAFRVHVEQKTSAAIHTTGHQEMDRIRSRIHGSTPSAAKLEQVARSTRLASGITARLFTLGLRF